MFTENLYFIIYFSVIRKVISIVEIRKCRWFALGPIVNAAYQLSPICSLLGIMVNEPWLSKKRHSFWRTEEWFSNRASRRKWSQFPYQRPQFVTESPQVSDCMISEAGSFEFTENNACGTKSQILCCDLGHRFMSVSDQVTLRLCPSC